MCIIRIYLWKLIFIITCPMDHLNQMQKLIGEVIHIQTNNKYKQLFDSNGTKRYN